MNKKQKIIEAYLSNKKLLNKYFNVKNLEEYKVVINRGLKKPII
jgi:hypothetical protein